MKNLGIFFFILALAFTACRKDINDVNEVTTTPDPTFLENYVPTYIQVNGDLTGFIVNDNNAPLQDVQVKLGALTTTTDQFGHFFFTNIDMNAAGTIVQVEKEGYFAGSRRFNAVADVENRIKIQLMAKNFSYSFESESGGTVLLNGDATVLFAPNSIQKTDGTPYNGVVKVAATWLDPSKNRTLNQMPGNLFGVNNLGEEVALGTYGMIAVELESDAGEPLNILEGNTATITMPVPINMQMAAPAEIPLWSYNEEFGVWAEEGVATLDNGYYVGEVTHFSFWNCDIPYPTVNFTTMITDEDGNPLENYLVSVAFDTIFTGCAYTSADGVVNGEIPANESLTLSIYGLCGEVLYTVEIGPFSVDVDFGTIMIPASLLDATTITGELVDCDGVSVQNGVVIVNAGNITVYEYVNSSEFDLTFTSCASSDVEVIGYDLTELVQSDVVTAVSNMANDLGDISVCDIQLQNYISLSIDGGSELIYLDAAAVDSSSATILIQSITNSTDVNIQFYGSTIGDYGGNNFIFLSDIDNSLLIAESSFSTFTVTEYGNVGEPIIGTFSGVVTNYFDSPSVNVDVTGSFNIIRVE